MSYNGHLVLQHVNRGAAYLWNPPNDSWVSSFAGAFFVMALVVASPVILLLALDFTSYAIVRTLGIEHAHPTSSKPPTPSSSSSSLSSTPTTPSKPHSHHHPSTPSTIITPPEYFTTPGGGNLELAGVGVFSPPQSRTPSPPITRKNTNGSLSSMGMRHATVPHSLGSILDAEKGTSYERGPVPLGTDDPDADKNTIETEQGRPSREDAITREDDHHHASSRNDSTDDDDATPSSAHVLLRRRKGTTHGEGDT